MSDEENKKVTNTKNTTGKKSSRFLSKFILFLIVIGVIGGGGYALYDKMLQEKQQLAQEGTQNQAKINQLNTNVNDIQRIAAENQQALKDLTEKFLTLKHSMQSVEEVNNKEPWVAAEAKYFVKIASMNVKFRANPSVALDLLKMANQELGTAENSKFEEAQKAISSDIANLEAVPVVDKVAIYMKLYALNQKIDKLPLLNVPNSSANKLQPEAATTEQPWWQKGLNATWSKLKDIVVVRYNDSGKLPLIPPEQQVFLYQNLNTTILQAMMALLQNQNEIFHASLLQAVTWINDYCVQDSQVTQSVLADLNGLKEMDISPEIPSIDSSLNAVNSLQVS